MPTNLTDRIIWTLCIIAFKIQRFLVQTQMRLQAKSQLQKTLFAKSVSLVACLYFIGLSLVCIRTILTEPSWVSFTVIILLFGLFLASSCITFLVFEGGIHGKDGVMDRLKKDAVSFEKKLGEYSQTRELLKLNDIEALGFDTTLCLITPFSTANSRIEEMIAFDNPSSYDSLRSLCSKISGLKQDTEVSLDVCERNLRLIRDKLDRANKVSNTLRNLHTIWIIQSTCTSSQLGSNRLNDDSISTLITILLGYLEDGGTIPSWRFEEDSDCAPEVIFDAIDKRMRHAQVLFIQSESILIELDQKQHTVFLEIPHWILNWNAS